MRNLIIITGASKGLGEGIAMALAKPENHITCISRGINHGLQAYAAERNCHLEFKQFDLSFAEKIGHLAQELFGIEKIADCRGIYLVNNAGVVEPVGNAGSNEITQIIAHMTINLLSPMILMAEFIRLAGDLPIKKRVINISSGAAANPYEGWSAYCSGKAGLEMYSRCVAKEQKLKEFPVEVMSVAPGVIDTDMQKVIRNTSIERFMHKERFVQMKENGILVRPTVAGMQIARLLLSDQFENGGVIDIRNSCKKP